MHTEPNQQGPAVVPCLRLPPKLPKRHMKVSECLHVFYVYSRSGSHDIDQQGQSGRKVCPTEAGGCARTYPRLVAAHTSARRDGAVVHPHCALTGGTARLHVCGVASSIPIAAMCSPRSAATRPLFLAVITCLSMRVDTNAVRKSAQVSTCPGGKPRYAVTMLAA